MENVTAAPLEHGSGQVTVENDGLVPQFTITQSGEAGPAAFTYELDRDDATVEPPAWAANVSTSGPNRTKTTASSS